MKVVLLVVVGALVGAMASCTSHDPDVSQHATLRVHIGLFGGPATRHGGMALRNSPAPHENVTALDEAGHEFAGRTDAQGVATLRLAPGRYLVFSTYCGSPTSVTLVADATRRVQIVCPVP